MCGIAGYFGPIDKVPNNLSISSCLKQMKRRGPDSQNYIIKKYNKKTLILLHSRLSIIDPVKISNQPMEDEDAIISFNGEIYNYLELKKNLNIKKLATNSDTEVLLKYLKIKKNIPKDDLDGMWSYAYFDKKKKNLFLSRDRFGEKPLYYKVEKDSIYFGSDINYIISLSKEKKIFNEEKIYSFLANGFKSLFLNNKTFLNGINALSPAHVLKVDINNNLKLIKYWKNTKTIAEKKISYKEAVKTTKEIISTEFKKRFRSDFPIGCLLSGGIDSTAISAHSIENNKKLKYYSINSSNPNYNESPRIDVLCQKYNLKTNYVKMSQLNNYDFLEKIIGETNFPLSSISYLVYAHLNKEIKNDKYRVLLSGLGGDEIFAGYYTHQMNFLISNLKNEKFNYYYKSWETHVKPLIRSNILSNLDEYISLANSKNPSFHEKKEIEKYLSNKKLILVNKKIKFSKNFFRNGLDVDMFRDTLPPQLLSSDQISMFFSIENRSPFLSHKLYEFVKSLPDDYLIRNGFGKSVLRDSLKNMIPDKILKFREKIGFYADLDLFFDRKSKLFRDMLFQNHLVNSFINIKKVEILLSQKKLFNAEAKFIFCVLNLAILISKK